MILRSAFLRSERVRAYCRRCGEIAPHLANEFDNKTVYVCEECGRTFRVKKPPCSVVDPVLRSGVAACPSQAQVDSRGGKSTHRRAAQEIRQKKD